MNQALTYGFSHRVPTVVLAFPSYDETHDLEAIGAVDGVTLFKATVSLGSTNPGHTEDQLAARILSLLRPPAHVG